MKHMKISIERINDSKKNIIINNGKQTMVIVVTIATKKSTIAIVITLVPTVPL